MLGGIAKVTIISCTQYMIPIKVLGKHVMATRRAEVLIGRLEALKSFSHIAITQLV